MANILCKKEYSLRYSFHGFASWFHIMVPAWTHWVACSASQTSQLNWLCLWQVKRSLAFVGMSHAKIIYFDHCCYYVRYSNVVLHYIHSYFLRYPKWQLWLFMMLIQCIFNPFVHVRLGFLMFSGGRERVHWEQMG